MKPKEVSFTCLMSIACLIALSLIPGTTSWADSVQSDTVPTPSMATLQSSYGKLPLSFEANHGQWDPAVQFVTRGRGHTLFLTPSEAVLTLRTGEAEAEERAGDFTQRRLLSTPPAGWQSIVRMRFEEADSQAEMAGLEPLPGIVNYFIGDDPSKWRTNIPTYQKVEYKNLYDGIDLVYYGNQGQLEYDLIVAPGADPSQIMLAFDGAERITVDEQGDLVLTLAQSSTETAEGAVPTLRLHKPVVYQRDQQGEKHLLASAYVLRTAESAAHPTVALHPQEIQQVVFQVASYDTSQPLIIDPVLSWATYLGGSDYGEGMAIAVDTAGNAYMTGWTRTPGSGFPGAADSPIQSTYGGGNDDAFVTKLNATGTTLVYSTYLGSSGPDEGRQIVVDTGGNAYVTGITGSSNFPGTGSSPMQNTLSGISDAFVTKLSTAGTALVYSTYLGGSGRDGGVGIAVDAAGNAYVTGDTESSDFPRAAGSPIQNAHGGGILDAFVAKLNAAGTALLYSTYLGGNGTDVGIEIALDSEGQRLLDRTYRLDQLFEHGGQFDPEYIWRRGVRCLCGKDHQHDGADL